MATITDRLGSFTGHIGQVQFQAGIGRTNDPDLIEFFSADPDRWDVADADQAPEDESADGAESE